MDKITYNEYLEALDKVRSYHFQTETETIESESFIAPTEGPIVDIGIVDLLRKNATDRLVYGIKYFLDLEITYSKIAFESPEEVPTSFFVRHYTLKQLKVIRNLGVGSLVLCNKILFNAGYKMLV